MGIEILNDALDGRNGEDQRLIAEKGLSWIVQLLQKNQDYGSSVFNPPILAPDCPISAAIRVRMSDKIARLSTLLTKGQEPKIKESLEDTFNDLGAYCLLLLVERERNG